MLIVTCPFVTFRDIAISHDGDAMTTSNCARRLMQVCIQDVYACFPPIDDELHAHRHNAIMPYYGQNGHHVTKTIYGGR